MRAAKRLATWLPLAALLVLAAAVACDTGEDDGDSAAFEALAQLGEESRGIQVNGTGRVAIAPDIALLYLGVEVMDETVAEARGGAATAMNAVMAALRARGIEDRDIQTSLLNISPEYTYEEVFKDGARSDRRVLTGYRVNNNVVVTVRDLDAVGEIVDEVAEAGGDATRIENVNFSAEDTTEAKREAREKAVMDAIDRADQLAAHTGVTRGSLTSVSESYDSYPVPRASYDSAFLMAEAGTSVSPGELQITVNVFAVFAIEGR